MSRYGSRGYRVKEWVLEQLRQGVLQAGDRLPPPATLAQQLEVSELTVQRAMNALAREGVVARKRRVGTFLLQNPLKTPRISLRIALLLPKSMGDVHADFYLSSLYQGIQQGLEAQEASLALWDYERLAQFVWESYTGAVAIAPPLSRMGELRALADKIPLVAVGANAFPWGIDSITCDNHTPMRTSVQLLQQAGHRRLVGLFADLDAVDTQERLHAFAGAVAEAGIEQRYMLWTQDTFQIEPTTQQQLVSLLRLPPAVRPTALVAGGFYLAMGVLQIAHGMGIRVPDELSIIAFDDPPAAALTTPPLSTYRQPLQAMGAAAIQRLLERLRLPTTEPTRQQFPTPFIQRASISVAAQGG